MSGLEDLYREIILDHYRNPRNRGELEVPPAVRADGFNPLCGDEVIVYLGVSTGVIEEVTVAGQGCSISQSSASMMTQAVRGRTVAEARRLISAFKAMMSIHGSEIGSAASRAGTLQGLSGGLDKSKAGTDDGNFGDDPGTPVTLGDLEALRGVVKFPVRIKCATLSWNTLIQALDEAISENS